LTLATHRLVPKFKKYLNKEVNIHGVLFAEHQNLGELKYFDEN
jgi:hypothetical protein